MERKISRCVLCGSVYGGYGHNAYPIRKDGRCCDDCNSMYVIPIRFMTRNVPQYEFEDTARMLYRKMKKAYAA